MRGFITCSVVLWGGRKTANNITGVCGECLQCFSHTGFAPAHGVCAFMVYTSQALGCSAGNCLSRALGCMHFPGLSRSGSGSQVLHKGTNSVGPAFCARPRSEHSHPQLKSATYRLPCPSCLVFWVYNGHAFSGVPCISSGELISGCDPSGGCQPSRIPRSLG